MDKILLNGTDGLIDFIDENRLQMILPALAILIMYASISHYFYKKRLRKLLSEQLQALKNERQRISSEIHDDIGAGFFAIKLFADVISKNGRQDEELKQLSYMINDLSEKIKEIIWSTNYENDNLENLIYYLEFQITKLFDHSPIRFQVEIPDQLPEKVISSDVRKNVYLVVKEFVHNAIKHADASAVNLTISLTNASMKITISDDGTGFDQTHMKINSMGLKNVNARIEKLNGTVRIDSVSGTKVNLTIPLP